MTHRHVLSDSIRPFRVTYVIRVCVGGGTYPHDALGGLFTRRVVGAYGKRLRWCGVRCAVWPRGAVFAIK